MASDPRKRQKKLERRTAKRKEKRHEVVRQQSLGVAERLGDASKYPVLHCWMGTTFEENGIGTVLLSRQLPAGQVAVATFLVDAWCLGVKDAHLEVLDRPLYDEKYVRRLLQKTEVRNVPPAEARKFIGDALAYAESLGLKPHLDYFKAIPLFEGVDPAESDAVFEFGQDGKPHFFAGPNDTPARCRQILATLTDTLGGPDKFHFTMPMSPFADESPFPGRLGHVRQIATDEEDGDESW
jgi:hypothetical protein